MILVTDKEVETLQSIEHLVSSSMAQGRPFVIIGECSEQVMQALNVNKMKGILKVCQIMPPSFGYRRGEIMEDIACATGAKYISEATGDNFEVVHPDDLGSCTRFIAGRTHTVIMTDNDIDLSDRIKMIEDEIAQESNPHNVAIMKERLGSLTGGVAVIYVGAMSDIELKEKRDRVDDAVCATTAAIEEGILPGGGVALLDLSNVGGGANESERVAWHILHEAMRAPFKQILTNGGLDAEAIMKDIQTMDPGIGYDVSGLRIGKMMYMGIIDPTKVTVSALENAVSVATTILSTNCIITNVRADEGTR